MLGSNYTAINYRTCPAGAGGGGGGGGSSSTLLFHSARPTVELSSEGYEPVGHNRCILFHLEKTWRGTYQLLSRKCNC